ncbi:MAG: methyltransferase [Pseudomonadota bacterium]
MLTLESFKKQCDVTTTELVIRDRRFSFFVPRSLDRFIHSENTFHDFPLWVKVWEASFILAEYLAGLESDHEKHFFEIGCGLGVVGIVASSFGHNVTMTEYDQDARHFARANALLNLPAKDSKLEIMKLDWNRPQIQRDYDYIIGSEIVYKETDFHAILNLFRSCLKDGGEVILAGGIRKTTIGFMRQMSEFFHITAHKKILRSIHEEIMVLLCRMTFKQTPESSPPISP